MMLANTKTVSRAAVAARTPSLPAVRPRSLVVRRFKVGWPFGCVVQCSGALWHALCSNWEGLTVLLLNARVNELPCLEQPYSPYTTLLCHLPLQEGEQVDTSEQGGKAPKNPLTGQPLTPVTDKNKEGYQATVLAGQSDETSARIMKQLPGPDGRPFGGRFCGDGLFWHIHNCIHLLLLCFILLGLLTVQQTATSADFGFALAVSLPAH